jgi:NitT/TauT family transport system substrate-binding protein
MKKGILISVSLIVLILIGGSIYLFVKNKPEEVLLEKVTLQLNWTDEVEFSGYYTAKEKKYYEGQQLDVEIKAREKDTEEIEEVLSGRADFAVGDMGKIANSSNASELVVIAVIFQIHPSVFFSHIDSGIESPYDFIGKKIAIKSEGWRDTYTRMMENIDVDKGKITVLDVSDDITLFYDKKVDVWSGYAHDEPVEAQLAGYETNFIYPVDYGVMKHAGAIFTTRKNVNENPELVKRFLKASLDGWNYTIQHPDEVAQYTVNRNPDELILEFQEVGLSKLIPLMHTGDVPFGWINEQVMKEVFPVKVGEQSVYTTQFLEEIYGKQE